MDKPDSITINKQSLIYLNETRKWTMFFSIIGFIAIALMILAATFIGSLIGSMAEFNDVQQMPGGFPTGMMSGLYIIMAILYFFPIYYLYQFSTNMKTGIQQRSAEYVEQAFKYQKSHYKFMGVLTGILLAFYAVIILGALIVGSIL